MFNGPISFMAVKICWKKNNKNFMLLARVNSHVSVPIRKWTQRASNKTPKNLTYLSNIERRKERKKSKKSRPKKNFNFFFSLVYFFFSEKFDFKISRYITYEVLFITVHTILVAFLDLFATSIADYSCYCLLYFWLSLVFATIDLMFYQPCTVCVCVFWTKYKTDSLRQIDERIISIGWMHETTVDCNIV